MYHTSVLFHPYSHGPLVPPYAITLRNHFLHDVAVHVGQAKTAALKLERQPLVIDSQQVQDRGLEVVHVDGAFDDVEAELVGRTVA